ncbi:hypothetical protein PK35_15045 [Tamlana nanhaiensis]|uniref:Uncharacterized protein n=1 Tax=Neotamlana nanhaiensis TaxID=1382798 RepID=A0A0D7VX54_9FLAO|nr:T9SS type B sorting domain-containing protein [Tamlana nanhaiensis]KJD31421.1 hypothetical protein PK35_15045 [Tamlana nanhaiensis]
MYVDWNLNRNNYRLYEVTVNANRDYISHIDLGQIPSETYGLASELGKLYGVTPTKLYEINLTDFSFLDIVENPSSDDLWFGATGLHEAVNFKLITYNSIFDAEQDINQLEPQESFTVNDTHTRTLFVKIINNQTGNYTLVKVNLNVYSYPNVNPPLDLISCYSVKDGLNKFNLNEVSVQMQKNISDNLVFNYFTSDPEMVVNSMPLPSLYQSTRLVERIFVSVENTLSGCTSYFKFNLVNISIPSLVAMSSYNNPLFLDKCYIDRNNLGYFQLDEIANDVILITDEHQLFFYSSFFDAENNVNPLDSTYYLNEDLKEIFVKVVNEAGCYEITNFFLSMDCIDNNYSLINLKFPKFFTPNNDGINDSWNISGVSKKVQQESLVVIFNRYGKKMASFNPYNSNGWDGTYRGKQLPNSDYWFSFSTSSGYSTNGHFTLKR